MPPGCNRLSAAEGRVAVGYNVQVAVDAKHKLTVEQQVTNQVADMGLSSLALTRSNKSGRSRCSRLSV